MSLTLSAIGSTAQLHKELAALRSEFNIPVLAYSLLDAKQAATTKVFGASASTPMRWGSVTKTITALTVLQLAKAGLVDLNAPLHHYVSAKHWNNAWRKSHPVRVIHLLELTAGFTDLARVEFNYNQPISLSDALALAPAHRTTLWPPGLQHSYSNLAPGLSQLLIEAVTNLSYAEAANKYVLSPLAMNNTNFAPHTELPGGFKADGKTPIAYWHMTFPAYGAMNAPITDLIRLSQGLLTLSEVFYAHTVDHLLVSRSSAAARSGFTFDYASGFYARIRQGLAWHGHGGDADGYRSRIALLPVQGRGYVVVINTDNPKALRRIEQRLEQHISQQVPVATEPDLFELNKSALARLAGTYYPGSTRFGLQRWTRGQSSAAKVVVSDDGKTLTFIRDKQRTQLMPMTKYQFRRVGDPVATVVFIPQGEQIYLQGELGSFFNTSSCPEFARRLLKVCGSRN